MNRRVFVPIGLALAAAIGAACTAVPTDANRAVSLEFDTTAFPAIVSGDTLRDSLSTFARPRPPSSPSSPLRPLIDFVDWGR